MTTRFFTISRSSPSGTARRPDVFEVSVDARMTVLDALFAIQRDQDPSLSFRCSCRVGMCGTCAVSVNRMPKLACKTRVQSLAGTVTVEPLPQLPVFKDLIVSLAPFFEQWKRSLPALHPLHGDSQELARVPPDSEFGREARDKRDCITCGACFSACTIKGINSRYLGPAAINRAFLRLLDPRDTAVKERLQVINEESGGVWRCHTQFNCVAACPKGINLTDSIGRLKRAMLRPQKFHEKIRRANRTQV